METKHRKGGFLFIARLEADMITFPDEGVSLDKEHKFENDSRPILVAVTGTQQKQEMIREVAGVDGEDSLFSGFEIFTRIDVDEISGSTGGDVVRAKAEDFATKLWEKLKGADTAHRGAILANRIFLLCDTKMSIGLIGHWLKPVHKLRTLLQEENIEIANKKALLSLLPQWWVNTFSAISEGHDVVVRWSTGDAAVKFVQDAKGEYAGKYILAYADSKASVVLPHRLINNIEFWKAYLKYGMAKRGEDISVHLGASMGVLIEDIIEMVRADTSWGVTENDLNLLLPPIPDGLEEVEYLNQHAKGAPKDVIDTVVSWIVPRTRAGIGWLGTREARQISS
jgi:hypothetical protein